MIRQDSEAVLRKRRPQDVRQKARATLVVDGGTRVSLRVQVRAAVLHHEVPNDLRPTTCGQDHRLAPALGGARQRLLKQRRRGRRSWQWWQWRWARRWLIRDVLLCPHGHVVRRRHILEG